MDPRLLTYLGQLKSAAEQSIEFVAGMEYADFEQDTKTQRAVTMNLVILAEVAAKIEERFPTLQRRIRRLPGEPSEA